jgi:hypothetical protein
MKHKHGNWQGHWNTHHWGQHSAQWSAPGLWWAWIIVPIVLLFGFSILLKFWWLWLGLGIFAMITLNRQGWVCDSGEKAKNDDKPKRDFTRSYAGSDYETGDDEPPVYRV